MLSNAEQKELYQQLMGVPESTAYEALEAAYNKLVAEKPTEPGAQARRYAVCITQFEMAMAWYVAYCQTARSDMRLNL